MHRSALALPLGVAAMLASLGAAHADRPLASGGEPCSDAWCGTRQAWATADSGAGPETLMATLVNLGAVGETLSPLDRGPRTETAALFGFEFRFPLALTDRPGYDERVLRLRVTGQRLGWRVGDPGGGAGQADTGGSVALGYTETLRWLSRWSKLAATLDAEGATGLGVASGLGLRTVDESARAVGAAGLALGLHSRVGGFRAHARVLHALTADAGWSSAIEVGAGVATRFDWPRFHGPWPIEVWVDLRERRGLGAAGDAGERVLTTGLSYRPQGGFSRIGLVGSSTEERLADGTTGSGRALLVQFERPFGDL